MVWLHFCNMFVISLFSRKCHPEGHVAPGGGQGQLPQTLYIYIYATIQMVVRSPFLKSSCPGMLLLRLQPRAGASTHVHESTTVDRLMWHHSDGLSVVCASPPPWSFPSSLGGFSTPVGFVADKEERAGARPPADVLHPPLVSLRKSGSVTRVSP